MSKPTQYELDICGDVLAYLSKVTAQYESYAVHTIAAYDEARLNIPCVSELEDLKDG